MQETLAGTVLLKFFFHFSRGLRGPENDGRHGTFECADARNTGRDGTFETVYMSDFCRGVRALTTLRT